jgi:hypothetical protein
MSILCSSAPSPTIETRLEKCVMLSWRSLLGSGRWAVRWLSLGGGYNNSIMLCTASFLLVVLCCTMGAGVCSVGWSSGNFLTISGRYSRRRVMRSEEEAYSLLNFIALSNFLLHLIPSTEPSIKSHVPTPQEHTAHPAVPTRTNCCLPAHAERNFPFSQRCVPRRVAHCEAHLPHVSRTTVHLPACPHLTCRYASTAAVTTPGVSSQARLYLKQARRPPTTI